MKPSLVARRPGTRPESPRSWIHSRRRRRPPPQETRAGSTLQTSNKPAAASATLKQKIGRRIPVEKRRDAAGQLLNRAPTREDSPPRTRRRCRSRAPPRGGRVREDLFQRNAAASASPASPGNPNLDTLGPNLQTTLTAGERAAVSTTSRCPGGHRRRGRPPSPPTATRSPFFPSVNCSGTRAFERDTSVSRYYSGSATDLFIRIGN